MKLLVVAVYDAAVRAFVTPLFFRSKPEAIRAFADACKDEKGNFFRHRSDYHLAVLGDWDDASGAFTVLAIPERLVTANECIQDDNVLIPDSYAKTLDDRVGGFQSQTPG